MNPLPSSALCFPPPYTKPTSKTDITQVPSTSNTELRIKNKHRQRRHHRRKCHICSSRTPPSGHREIGPYLMHRTQPDLVSICPCRHRAHPVCLLKYGTDYRCNVCSYIYQSKWYIAWFSQILCLVCHILSLASAVGLVFGLSHLGRVLDEIGLGSEMGPKLDGDETWQDHEMSDIKEWLNIVHFATGVAGEALLGLVYIVGVCLVVGVERTLEMVSSILYIQLNCWKPKWIRKWCIYIFLCVLGLVLGTYLLFFSWIWASVLHHVRKRVLDIKMRNIHSHYCDKNKSVSLVNQSTIPLESV